MGLKLYKLVQDAVTGYDVYDSCIVLAKNEESAKRMCPAECLDFYEWSDEQQSWMFKDYKGGREVHKRDDWANNLEDIKVNYLEEACPKLGKKPRVLCASFNAG